MLPETFPAACHAPLVGLTLHKSPPRLVLVGWDGVPKPRTLAACYVLLHRLITASLRSRSYWQAATSLPTGIRQPWVSSALSQQVPQISSAWKRNVVLS